MECPSRREGHKHFSSAPHSWGTRDSPRLTAIFNLPCKYNNIFIKVLQGHPGTNRTTTKGNVRGPKHSSSSLCLAAFPAVWLKLSVSWEPTEGYHGESTWRKYRQIAPCRLKALWSPGKGSRWKPVSSTFLTRTSAEQEKQAERWTLTHTVTCLWAYQHSPASFLNTSPSMLHSSLMRPYTERTSP